MYGHGFLLKLDLNHFQRYSTLIFNIEKSSTNFGYKNESFTKIRFFQFYIFYSQ